MSLQGELHKPACVFLEEKRKSKHRNERMSDSGSISSRTSNAAQKSGVGEYMSLCHCCALRQKTFNTGSRGRVKAYKSGLFLTVGHYLLCSKYSCLKNTQWRPSKFMTHSVFYSPENPRNSRVTGIRRCSGLSRSHKWILLEDNSKNETGLLRLPRPTSSGWS